MRTTLCAVDNAERRRIQAAADIVERARGERSKRAVAKAAGISEGWYRQVLAGGFARGGTWYPAPATDKTWLAICRASGADVAAVFDALQRSAPVVPVEEPVGQNIAPEVMGRLAELHPDELTKVLGYIDGVIAGRGAQ